MQNVFVQLPQKYIYILIQTVSSHSVSCYTYAVMLCRYVMALRYVVKAAVPPAVHPVLRITMVRNRSETVVLYLVKQTWRRQERQPQVRRVYSYTVYD